MPLPMVRIIGTASQNGYLKEISTILLRKKERLLG